MVALAATNPVSEVQIGHPPRFGILEGTWKGLRRALKHGEKGHCSRRSRQHESSWQQPAAPDPSRGLHPLRVAEGCTVAAAASLGEARSTQTRQRVSSSTPPSVRAGTPITPQSDVALQCLDETPRCGPSTDPACLCMNHFARPSLRCSHLVIERASASQLHARALQPSADLQPLPRSQEFCTFLPSWREQRQSGTCYTTTPIEISSIRAKQERRGGGMDMRTTLQDPLDPVSTVLQVHVRFGRLQAAAPHLKYLAGGTNRLALAPCYRGLLRCWDDRDSSAGSQTTWPCGTHDPSSDPAILV